MNVQLLNYFSLLIFSVSFLLMPSPPKIYHVKKIKKPIQVTGKGKDKQWKKAKQLCDFSFPWQDKTPPKTNFKALYDKTHFYFLFRATDAKIIQKEKRLKERATVHSDRVELFFKDSKDNKPYYSLELDALGRILDTKANFYQTIDVAWTWPTNELLVKTSIDPSGYWVEGSISLASLRTLGVYKEDGILRIGLYRADYIMTADGNIQPQWISWVQPDSKTPNFHIPSSFGVLKLMD